MNESFKQTKIKRLSAFVLGFQLGGMFLSQVTIALEMLHRNYSLGILHSCFMIQLATTTQLSSGAGGLLLFLSISPLSSKQPV